MPTRAPIALLRSAVLGAALLAAAACGGGGDHAAGGDGGTGGGTGADAGAGGPDGGAPASFPASWSLVLQARTNFSVNDGGAYNIPADHFLDGPTIWVTNAGKVAFAVPIAPDNLRHLWYGDDQDGGLVYDSPAGAFVGGMSLSGAGAIAFDMTMAQPEGLYQIDAAGGGEAQLLTTEPFGALGRGTPLINDHGDIGFRASVGAAHAHYVWPAGGPLPGPRAAETALDPQSPYSYLFSPAFNGRGDLAGQARRGPGQDDSQPDEIVLWPKSGDPVVIAEDADADSSSPYAGFDASRIGLNDRGQVAFIADLVEGGRAVLVSDGTDTVTIAREGQDQVGSIEYFSPVINRSGWVVFRATDADGAHAIWLGDGTELRKVVTEHDAVTIDLGAGMLAQEAADVPVFAGTPTVNDHGDVAFAAGVTPADDDQVEWGTAVFVARAQD